MTGPLGVTPRSLRPVSRNQANRLTKPSRWILLNRRSGIRLQPRRAPPYFQEPARFLDGASSSNRSINRSIALLSVAFSGKTWRWARSSESERTKLNPAPSSPHRTTSDRTQIVSFELLIAPSCRCSVIRIVVPGVQSSFDTRYNPVALTLPTL